MKSPGKHRRLSPAQRTELLTTLEARFVAHRERHEGVEWPRVLARLEANPGKLWPLHEMESSGGEPDVVAHTPETDAYRFCDCSTESPAGRRSLCYDREALESRKEHKPRHSAVELAAEMGIDLLTEEQYRALQRLGEFDTKTSSWVKTPDEIRKQGGALFCDRRYGQVFTYHNGAQSYYAARGFRGTLEI